MSENASRAAHTASRGSRRIIHHNADMNCFEEEPGEFRERFLAERAEVRSNVF